MPSRVILVGVGGFGDHFHLPNIRRLRATGLVEPIALVDPVVNAKSKTDPHFVIPNDAPLFDTLSEAIARVGVPDIVIVSVPIHLHAPITKEALRYGADVLLEKPPFARMQDFQEVRALEKETGRVVQVGFQSLGSLAIHACANGDVGIGEIKSVRAMGTWLRRSAYWQRAAWVGRRHIGEIDVMDGVATNALAHAVITALHIAGIKTASDVRQIEIETYRANAIDVDDTTSIRVTPNHGALVVAALTLCASEQTKPLVEIAGDKGIAILEYVTDDLVYQDRTLHYNRVDMLQNLIDYRTTGAPLLLPLSDTGAFMRVMEAIRTSGPPIHIERKYIDQRGEGIDSHPVVQDIEKWVRAAAAEDKLFSEVGAPWAFTGKDSSLTKADIDGRPVFEVLDGAGTTPSSTPRPYVHPVRTLGSVEVTATHPSDHDWHCGVGFAVPDVDGTSFWGGGTFIKGQGYVMLDNHGRIKSDSVETGPGDGASASNLVHRLSWYDRENRHVISEKQSIQWSKLVVDNLSAWEFAFRTTLSPVTAAVSLGSPGTNGRKDGGYGGFFWRLPRCTDVTILSSDSEGEDAIHGSVSSWISWSARFEAGPGLTGEATLVFVADDDTSAQDPWIVRCSGYPGVGSAVAWEDKVEIPAEGSLTRGFRVAVVDGNCGKASSAEIARLLLSRRGSIHE
jgi:predicted dehydrogenase